jgi:hypothetical protein
MSVAATLKNALLPRVGAVVARQLIVARLVHIKNTILPMLVTLLGMVTLVRAVLLQNLSPRLGTLLPIVMLVRLAQ